jgi:Natural resistance-associated macrophage protein
VLTDPQRTTLDEDNGPPRNTLRGSPIEKQDHRPSPKDFCVGPGLLVMLADTDCGNVVTGAQAGAQWGYRLLLVALMPMPYMVQELTVRLGIYTGRGHGELIRERFGVGWAWLSTTSLAAATIGSLITEFHRSGRDRRTLRPVTKPHLARRRGGPAHRRGQGRSDVAASSRAPEPQYV